MQYWASIVKSKTEAISLTVLFITFKARVLKRSPFVFWCRKYPHFMFGFTSQFYLSVVMWATLRHMITTLLYSHLAYVYSQDHIASPMHIISGKWFINLGFFLSYAQQRSRGKSRMQSSTTYMSKITLWLPLVDLNSYLIVKFLSPNFIILGNLPVLCFHSFSACF